MYTGLSRLTRLTNHAAVGMEGNVLRMAKGVDEKPPATASALRGGKLPPRPQRGHVHIPPELWPQQSRKKKQKASNGEGRWETSSTHSRLDPIYDDPQNHTQSPREPNEQTQPSPRV